MAFFLDEFEFLQIEDEFLGRLKYVLFLLLLWLFELASLLKLIFCLFTQKFFYSYFVIFHSNLGTFFLNKIGGKVSAYYNVEFYLIFYYISINICPKSIGFKISDLNLDLINFVSKKLTFSTTLILEVIVVLYQKYSSTSFLFLKHLKKSLLFYNIVLEIIILIT